MRLRTQLLLINVLSVAILVVAVVYSYSIMLLNLKQARILTLIAVGAGILSSAFYWLLTVPITGQLRRLMEYADKVGSDGFDAKPVEARGPYEIRQLNRSIQVMNRSLQDSFEQLETMEHTRRELIANVSHDLRTPIASIQSFVEALDDGVIEDKETAHVYLTTIHREVLRLSVLIDDLFELSKLEAGQQSFRPELTRIDRIILEALESCKVRIAAKKLSVSVEVADDIPALMLMQDKIARVVNNLLDNAIRHSPTNGMLRLKSVRVPEDNCIEVAIADEGEGIAPEHREWVFQRFFRTDKSRQRQSGGAGLGLAIARELIELHNGKIGVRSAKWSTDGGGSGFDRGSEFWFRLPLVEKLTGEKSV